VLLGQLWLTDFRSYVTATLEPSPTGLTVVEGANGEGKTNLLEAVGYLATLKSFRGAPAEALVRTGAEQAVVRAATCTDGRDQLIEAVINPHGRDRVQLNRQPLRRTRDLLGALVATVFTPDDLALVKGGPAGRRDFLDDLLVALHPRHDATQSEVDRVLKQRNALLRSALAGPGGGRGRGHPPEDVLATLEVWDAKLAEAGEALVAARMGLTAALSPVTVGGYGRLAVEAAVRGRATVSLTYAPSWEVPAGSTGQPGTLGLADALAKARDEDLRRGVTTVGPHRDELLLGVGGEPARTHASQGEQRSLALALRLAGHQVVTGRLGSPPVLLLDDVFSELDPVRAAALLEGLPEGQAILTTASGLPPGAEPEVVLRVAEGALRPS
jgi:DNA replication and repair protein RecF